MVKEDENEETLVEDPTLDLKRPCLINSDKENEDVNEKDAEGEEETEETVIKVDKIPA